MPKRFLSPLLLLIITIAILLPASVIYAQGYLDGQTFSGNSQEDISYPGLIPVPLAPEYQQYLDDLAKGETAKYGGIIPNQSPPRILESKAAAFAPAAAPAPLPESFDPRSTYLTPIKNQGRNGVCWAFGAVAAMESLVSLKTGRQNPYSEEHLRFIQSKQNPELRGAVGSPDDGGAFSIASDYLTNWNKGIATEASVPYYSEPNETWPTSKMAAARIEMHATGTRYLANNVLEIKNAVMEYGGVCIDIYSRGMQGIGGAYNSQGHLPDHAVCIVGWDDNYPASNHSPTVRPANDGAWLVKNSWGRSYGDEGYWWVPYQNDSINNEKTVAVLTGFHPDNNNEKMLTCNAATSGRSSYTYAGLPSSPLYFTNIYDLTAAYSTYGKITDVMFYNLNPGSNYNIYIVPLNHAGTLPDLSTLPIPLAYGTLPSEGYFTSTFHSPYQIPSPGRYAVIIKITPLAASDLYLQMYNGHLDPAGSYYYNAGSWNQCDYLDIRPILYKRDPVITDSLLWPASGSYPYPGSLPTTTMTLNGNSLVSIKTGDGTVLRQDYYNFFQRLKYDNDYKYGYDYALSDDGMTVIFTTAFLAKLSLPSTTVLYFTFSDGEVQTYTINRIDPVPVASLALDQTHIDLMEGDICNLTAEVAPANATYKMVDWLSSDITVATVDSKGKVTAVGAGTATIRVKAVDGDQVATCTVTVRSEILKVMSLTLNKVSTLLRVGDTDTLAATVTPANAVNQSLRFSSSNSSVVAVDNRGNLQAIAVGMARITASTSDGGKAAFCVVYVTENAVSVNPAISAGNEHTAAAKTDGTVWSWGYNNYNNLGNGDNTHSLVPKQVGSLSDVVSVSIGTDHTAALKSDGTVWTWGGNSDGQLGNGTTKTSSVPVSVNGLSDIISISANPYYTVALKSDGTVWAWGNNYFGQLGNGTKINSSVPVQVSGLSGVVSISAGNSHVAALKSDGFVWAWGGNYAGELGSWTAEDSTVPVQVNGLNDVVSVSAGRYYTVALKSDGTVWSWGNNNYGQLGDGSNLKSSLPVQVSDLSDVVSVSAGQYHAIALKSDGTVWGWGNNNYGQLGNGARINKPIPVQVSALNNIVSVSAGYYHTVAVQANGMVWAWGYNLYGQLGNDSKVDSWVPVFVNGFGNIIPITSIALNKTSLVLAAGESDPLIAAILPANATNKAVTWSSSNPYTAAVDNNGKVTAERAGVTTITVTTANGGQTAECAVTVNPAIPVTGVALDNFYLDLKIGDSASLVATVAPADATNRLVSWSSNRPDVAVVDSMGNIKALEAGIATITVRTEDAGKTATCAVHVDTNLIVKPEISAGYNHVVALQSDSVVRTWGWNYYGQLGIGTITDSTVPAQIYGLSGVVSVSAGYNHSVAAKSDGTVLAWGNNAYGQLGNNSTASSTIPVQVNDLSGVGAVSAGYYHTVALKSDGTVWAWGSNYYNQLGNSTVTGSLIPLQVSGLSGVISISAAYDHTLALKADGTVWAWGNNYFGQLGNGTTANSPAPVQVSGLSEIISVSAGQYYALALKADGTVWAWGCNDYGQLGDGTTRFRTTPVKVNGLNDVASVSSGTKHAIALKTDGTVWAWGDNSFGQLGNGTVTNSLLPVQLSNLSDVVSVAAGNNYSLALKRFIYYTYSAYIWSCGYNYYGQLGNNSSHDLSIPVQSFFYTTFSFTGVRLNKTSATLRVGDTDTLVATMAPWNITSKDAIWSSDKPTVATVDSSGKVTAKGVGMAVITVTTADGVNSDSCAVTVDPAIIPVTSVTFNKISTTITAGATETLVATVLPADATNKNLTWSSANPAVAAVDYSGKVTALAAGTAIISAVTEDGVRIASCLILVTGPVTSLQLSSGGTYNIFLKADGTVWSWGNNIVGQLGDGTSLDRSNPVQVSGLANIISVATGWSHTIALKADGTVWTWGDNSYGQIGDGKTNTRYLPVQVDGLSSVVSVAAGYYCSYALKSDGTVWAWGGNTYAQLGDGTTNNRSTPVLINGLANIISITGGYGHTIALKSDGTVWIWGCIDYGQFGKSTRTYINTPEQVGGLSNVISITSGSCHSVALKSDGTVWVWGDNGFSQLGDGAGFGTSIPLQVSGLSSIISVGGGDGHTVALKSDGTVWTWGYNGYGQLGDGTTLIKSTLVQVGALNDVVSVSAGYLHTAVLKADGTIWDWGDNSYGQLGNGTTSRSLAPVQVIFPTTIAVTGVSLNKTTTTIMAGATETLLATVMPVNATNKEVSWSSANPAVATVDGNGKVTALSAGTTTITVTTLDGAKTASCTVAVTPLIVAVTGVSLNKTTTTIMAGAMETLLATVMPVNATNKEVAWSSVNPAVATVDGNGKVTALSAGTTTITVTTMDGAKTASCTVTVTPQIVAVTGVSLNKTTTTITAGGTETLLATITPTNATNKEVSWSSANPAVATVDYSGKVTAQGAGTTTITAKAADGEQMATCLISVIGSGNLKVAAGNSHTIALKSNGTVWAWGWNFCGQLGNGTTKDKLVPIQVNGLNGVVSVSAGYVHSIALKSDGTVWSWGYNYYGQLGNGTTTEKLTPTQVSGLSGVVAVSAGYTHNIALKSDGTVWTWGYNNMGQLGNGTTVNSLVPVQVTGLNGVVSVSAACYHTVAVKSDGTVWAWGDNRQSQLGNGTMINSQIPVQVSGLNSVVSVSAGLSYTVAVKLDGTVWAWGDNSQDQLGNSMTANSHTPVQVNGLSNVLSVSAGFSHTVALKGDGSVWVWGGNYYGQLGNGTTINDPLPVQVSGLSNIVSASVGYYHSVAVAADGTIWTWGFNGSGQLGNETLANSLVPTQVNFSPIFATGIRLNKTTTTIIVGGAETLLPSVSPANATNKAVAWSSSNTAVATVDTYGNVTAVAVGKATITATTLSGNRTATCSVTVNPVPAYGISLDKSGAQVFAAANPGYGAQTALTVRVTNSGNQASGTLAVALSGPNAANFTLSRTSIPSLAINGSNTFTVRPKTGLTAGTYTAMVTVSGGNGISACFEVSFTVNPAAYGISLDQTATYLFPAANPGYGAQTALTVRVTNSGNQASGTLAVTLSGQNAANFTLSRTSIPSLAINGSNTFTVRPKTGLAAGTYTATVTVSGGNGISSCFEVSFTVNPAAYGISLDQTATYLFPAANPGYGAQTALTVRVTNSGNQASGTLAVALSGQNAANFTLSRTSISSLAINGSNTFTVVPKTGLAAGTYTATVTVSGGNGISACFEVSFTVNSPLPAPLYDSSFSDETDYDFNEPMSRQDQLGGSLADPETEL